MLDFAAVFDVVVDFTVDPAAAWVVPGISSATTAPIAPVPITATAATEAVIRRTRCARSHRLCGLGSSVLRCSSIPLSLPVFVGAVNDARLIASSMHADTPL